MWRGGLCVRDRCGGEVVSEVALWWEEFGENEGRGCGVSYRDASPDYTPGVGGGLVRTERS